MATPSLDELLAVSGPPLRQAAAAPGALPDALRPLHGVRDGFVTFFAALHVFPTRAAAGGGADLVSIEATLRAAYGPLLGAHRAFGQDLFGALFTVHPDGVCSFDPETGEHEVLAVDLDAWAGLLLAEPEALVGSAFAFDWQERHGALRANERLVPLLPFSLGGDYEDTNLEPRDTLRALRERGVLAQALAGLPDGAEIDWPLPGTREDISG